MSLKIVLSDLIVQLYNPDKSYQKFRLNNINIHDQPSRMHRSPPGVTKNFQIRKIQRLTNLT